MDNEIKLPPQIHVTLHNVVSNNPFAVSNVGAKHVIDITSLKYKDITVSNNFNVGACQFDLGIC